MHIFYFENDISYFISVVALGDGNEPLRGRVEIGTNSCSSPAVYFTAVWRCACESGMAVFGAGLAHPSVNLRLSQMSPVSSPPCKKKRSWSRAVFSNLQRKGLEKRFEVQKYVTKPDRRQLAAMLGLTDAQVSQQQHSFNGHVREQLG